MVLDPVKLLLLFLSLLHSSYKGQGEKIHWMHASTMGFSRTVLAFSGGRLRMQVGKWVRAACLKWPIYRFADYICIPTCRLMPSGGAFDGSMVNCLR